MLPKIVYTRENHTSPKDPYLSGIWVRFDIVFTRERIRDGSGTDFNWLLCQRTQKGTVPSPKRNGSVRNREKEKPVVTLWVRVPSDPILCKLVFRDLSLKERKSLVT